MLADLTPDQRRAVTHAGGPMLVLAGAGSGKTRVLCRRLAWLVEQGADPGEVLALTFSARAAEELRGRAEDLLGGAHATLRVMTFHAFAMDVVRVHGFERDLAPGLRPATQEERVLLLLDRLAELDLREEDLRRDPAQVADAVVRRIDRCRDELVEAGDFRRWAEERLAAAGRPADEWRARRDLEFARAFEAHDAWLAELGLEDFGMSLTRALALLRAHPDRLAAVAEGARHVMVDEFQDTNHAQAELLYLVAGGARSLVVVGDDDQGIYRFRGASTKNVTDFRSRFPDAPVVRLELNHRSTQAILDAAHAVVEPIPGRQPKALRALPQATGPAPELWMAPDPEGQARAVADGILALARAGVPLEEQAVLMRAVRTEARPVVEALERAGIPHQVHGGLGLLERREARAVIAWLRAVTDPSDAQAHLRLASDRAMGLPWVRAAEVVSEARAAGRGAAGALVALGEEVGEVVDRAGLRRAAIALGGAEGAARLADLAALERLAREVCRTTPGIDAAGLARRLDGLAAVGVRGDTGAPAERAGVQVMTVHQAKGLEFDAVFCIGMVHAGWPGRDRPGPDIPDALLPEALPRGRDAHVAEARRLAYVALTRARRHLILCVHRAGERGAPQRPSVFVEEARRALGDPPFRAVGESPDRAVLRRVGDRRRALEQAVAAAARARAAGQDDPALGTAVAAAADALVDARAEALAPPPPPAPPAAPAPRPARPGLDLSPTDISRYMTCPLAFRFARIDRVPPREVPARAIGVAAHAALEAHHRPGGTGGDADRLVARFAVELRRAGVDTTAEGRQALARARTWLPRHVERHQRSRVRTVAVEQAFTLHVGPHRVRGRIDRVDAHPQGGHQLVDYKTGRPPAEPDRRPGEVVLHLYLEGVRQGWGLEPRGATLDYVLDGEVRPLHPEPEEVAGALEVVREVADGIGARRFAPQPGWSCRSCDFALLCPAMDR
ncbi:MAG: ATP-dependent helicase [Thermoleophilia bacterium]|nr:ATP-dependent helicase [Thermoleophilia bacterium]